MRSQILSHGYELLESNGFYKLLFRIVSMMIAIKGIAMKTPPKMLLLSVLLIAISYPTAAFARELVEITGDSSGRKVYVRKDTIRRTNQFVWWVQEIVLYDSNLKLKEHRVVEYSGDCNEGFIRLQKFTNLINKLSSVEPDKNATLAVPGSIADVVLQYVCGK